MDAKKLLAIVGVLFALTFTFTLTAPAFAGGFRLIKITRPPVGKAPLQLIKAVKGGVTPQQHISKKAAAWKMSEFEYEKILRHDLKSEEGWAYIEDRLGNSNGILDPEDFQILNREIKNNALIRQAMAMMGIDLKFHQRSINGRLQYAEATIQEKTISWSFNYEADGKKSTMHYRGLLRSEFTLRIQGPLKGFQPKGPWCRMEKDLEKPVFLDGNYSLTATWSPYLGDLSYEKINSYSIRRGQWKVRSATKKGFYPYSESEWETNVNYGKSRSFWDIFYFLWEYGFQK